MTHIVQSPQWAKFKTEMGTTAIQVGDFQYTKHKIPFSSFYYAYCPKVDAKKIDWKKLKKSLEENGCVAINFDVPNTTTNDPTKDEITSIFEKHCIKSPKDTFAKSNVVLDITPDEKTLLASMHKKHRYNIKYAQRNGVTVEKGKDKNDFEIFYKLLSDTAARQKYYIHPKNYYKKIWEMLGQEGLCHILIAKHNNTPLVAWMLFTYDGALYYPYGGSSEKHKSLQGSNLIGWETIRLGKKEGCSRFDMWGAANNPNDKNDPWHGFTTFKLRYGGKHVTYIDSYDFVINETIYKLFNTANDIRWKILNLIK